MSEVVKFLDLRKQYLQIQQDMDIAIQNVLEGAVFIGGPQVSEFEERFALYQNAACCVGVGNGTDALEIAITALQLPAGSEILVPANTFIGSSEAVTRSGHRIVFCDCDPKTLTIDPADVRLKITSRTSAIMAVHLYGHPCNMDALLDLARDNDLKIIEDCAQAHGAKYKGRMVGTIGDISAFSFYPGKNLGAYGDAGAIITNDQALAKKCRMMANHGRIEKYDHEFEGRNSRLDTLQAAVLNVKLKHLDSWIERRRAIAHFYSESLAGIAELTLPSQAPWAGHAWHLFVVRASDREALRKHLEDEGIQTGIHYPIALHRQTAYRYLGQGDMLPVASATMNQLLSLPIGDHLEDEDIKRVVGAVCRFFS